MRHVYSAAIALALSALGAVSVFGQSSAASPVPGQSLAANLSIPQTATSYVLVSAQRVTRNQSYFTYQAILTNTGPAIPAVTATAISVVPGVTIVAGQGTLHFSPVPAHSQVTSTDTFTISTNSFFFDGSALLWYFLNPVANPGPNQTVFVESTVTLNGGGSTIGAGTGSLTYSWTLQSAPDGSMAVLSNANTMVAALVPDVPGTYIVRLTVNDGSGSDSANVTVSTENSPPVANAGPNQTVAMGATVQLNGSQSSDVDGDPLRYSWSFVSLPPTSLAALSSSRNVTTTFVADVAGTYIIQLVVNDGTFNSQPSTVSVTTGNTPPVANAGPNQKVNVETLVQLNGSGSTDVNGNPLTYQWTLNLTQAPGSNATLNSPTSVNPTFTADVPGTYVAQLIVNDGIANSNPATVTISTNAVQAPTANAGPNQSVVPGVTVTLDGSASTDPQGLPLTYTWSLITLPANSNAVLSATNVVNPKFVVDQSGTYVAQLTVSNGFLSSTVPATVTIATADVQPIANAGPSQTVIAGTTVTLDGSQSSDPDNQPLTYSWAFLSIPAGSNAVLIGPTTVNPSFVADVPGTYVAQLIVSDPSASSNPSTVTITANATAIALSPNPLNLSNSPGILTLTLNPPAGASPVYVGLSGFDPSVISVPNSVTVPANSNTVNVTVTPLAMGNTQVFAFASGYQPGNASVIVTTPSISIAFSNNATAVGLTHSINGTVTLSAPALAGGAAIALAGDPSAPGQVSFSPAMVTIPQGSTVGTFSLTGVALGSTTITASASGYNSGTAMVLVVPLGGISISQGLTVPSGQSLPLTVQLSTPAPVDGVTIMLASSDPTILTVPLSVFIPQGARSAQTRVTGLAIGSVSVTASSGGYTGDTETVNVVGTIGFLPQAVLVGAGGTQNILLLLSAPAPSGGLLVNLNSSNTSVATVPSSVNVSGQSATVQVTGVAPGSAIITANTSSPLFSAAGASVSVTVLPAP
jgi:PKD domain